MASAHLYHDSKIFPKIFPGYFLMAYIGVAALILTCLALAGVCAFGGIVALVYRNVRGVKRDSEG
jgi:hypothetical protein